MRIGCCGLIMLVAAGTVAQPLPTLGFQDLTVTALATVPHPSGVNDVAVDALGNVWLRDGFGLVRVTPSGAMAAFPISGRGLVRGLDGDVYACVSPTMGSTSLVRITSAGIATTIATWSGFDGEDLAVGATGGFFIGSDAGIFHLAQGSATPVYFAAGAPFGNRRIHVDASGRLFASDGIELVHVTGPTSHAVVHRVPDPSSGFPFELADMASGPFGQLFFFESWIEHGIYSGLFTQRFSSEPLHCVAMPGSMLWPWDESLPAIGEGLVGEWYLLSQATLYRLEGTPAVLSQGEVAPGMVRLDVDGPVGSALIVMFDTTPGVQLSYPGFGVFNTSLGTLPTFGVLVDGLGLFRAAEPSGIAPWTISIPLPAASLGVTVTVQACVLNAAAANGLFLISNPLVRTL